MRSATHGTLSNIRPLMLVPLLLAGSTVPALAQPQFKHIIVVIQENRTPDNLFGSNPAFEPGVDISNAIQTGQPLVTCYSPSHTHKAFEQGLTNFGLIHDTKVVQPCTLPTNPNFKYVNNSDVALYFSIAEQYGFANRMFQTNEGPSFPAHQFLFGGTSAPAVDSPLFAAENPKGGTGAGCVGGANEKEPLINGFGKESTSDNGCFDHNVLPDLLDAASIGWRYYSNGVVKNGHGQQGSIWTAPDAISHICGNVVNDLCTGGDWTNGDIVTTDPTQIVSTDIPNCALQAVSWVIPTANDSDHAGNDKMGGGPAWVTSIVNAVGSQAQCPNGETYWNDTAILIMWDDFGGWYDHVTPFQINLRQKGQPGAWGDGYTYGFRVPLLVVSAYTPKGLVYGSSGTGPNTGVLDFGNVVWFIEENFGLGFIGGQDMTTYGQYADYAAAQRASGTNPVGGNLLDFFLGPYRPFTTIEMTAKEREMLKAPKSKAPIDED